MSQKQEVKNLILRKYFQGMESLEDIAMEQMLIHSRKVEYYVINTLNLDSNINYAIQYLNPALYKYLGVGKQQHEGTYKENPNDDSVVKAALAFKMLVGD